MDKLEDKVVGFRLKSLMMTRDIPQAVLAEALDITPTYVSLIMSGKKKPSKKVVKKAAAFFDMSIEELHTMPKCFTSVMEVLATETNEDAMLCMLAIIDHKQQ